MPKFLKKEGAGNTSNAFNPAQQITSLAQDNNALNPAQQIKSLAQDNNALNPAQQITSLAQDNNALNPAQQIASLAQDNNAFNPAQQIASLAQDNNSLNPAQQIASLAQDNNSFNPAQQITSLAQDNNSLNPAQQITSLAQDNDALNPAQQITSLAQDNHALNPAQQITSLTQDNNALNPAQKEPLINSEQDNQLKSQKSKQIKADIQVGTDKQGSLQDSEDGTKLKRDTVTDKKCNSTVVQGSELSKESPVPEEISLKHRSDRYPESENRQHLGGKDISLPCPQGQEQEWENVLKAVKGYRPRNILIMSLTLQAAGTVFVAGLVSFFMSQTGWQRPNTVQVPIPYFNEHEAKDAFLQEVLSKLANIKDQQETNSYLTSEQYISDKENQKQIIEALQKKQDDDLHIFQDQYASDKENQKQFYEAQLKQQAEDLKIYYEKLINVERDSLEKDLKGQYVDLLTKEVESLTRFYDEKLQATDSTLHNEFEDKLQAVQEQCQANISSVNNTVLKSLDDARSELAEKHQQLGDKVVAMPKTLEDRGFTNIETFGPILLAVAVVELALVMCVCGLLCPAAGRRSGTGPGQLQANSPVVKQTNQQELPPIDTHNTNLAVICFRNSDEARCRKWSQAITESLTNKPQLVIHIVNSVDDVDYIPACRAALVFADPDEREMIIEDKRHVIGQGLRRLAVQRLMDSGVTVFVMIFHDKQPVNVKKRELLNSCLRQVEDHVLLQQLKRGQRLVSFGQDLADFQISHVAEQLATCFSTTRQR